MIVIMRSVSLVKGSFDNNGTSVWSISNHQTIINKYCRYLTNCVCVSRG